MTAVLAEPVAATVRRRQLRPCTCGYLLRPRRPKSRKAVAVRRAAQAQALPRDYIRPAASLLILRRADLRGTVALGPALVRAIAENV